MMTTSSPCRVSRSATSDPVMPAPTISASHLMILATIAGAADGRQRKPRRTAAAQIGLFGVV